MKEKEARHAEFPHHKTISGTHDAFHPEGAFSADGRSAEGGGLAGAGAREGQWAQVLLGATGTGKTFTMAKVIEQVQRPTLIISPNKTLAAQTASEFKDFFPTTRCTIS